MYLQAVLFVHNVFGKVDYERLADKLASGSRGRTYVFDALPADGSKREAKQKFLDRLKYLESFQVELGYVKSEKKTCPKCGCAIEFQRQKKVDILLATRLLERAEKVQKIILVAGDGDFTPAVEVAKQKAKVLLAYGEQGNTGAATQLKQACDSRILLDAAYFKDCQLPNQS